MRVLVYSATAGYRHDSIPAGVEAIRSFDGLEVEATEEPVALSDLTPYDAVVFLSISGDVVPDAGRTELERFVAAGGGFAGIHSATDGPEDWPWYDELIGARFDSHPDPSTERITVVDRDHPSTAHLPERWDRHDEWYVFERVAPGSRVLLQLQPDRPLAWERRVGPGRSWYTALGHEAAAYDDPAFRAHLLGGIRSVASTRGIA
ncbi:MAG TPA: ThuA domain-containing protein [Rhodoglobus sp.]|nr:ThuA domain-containing protein [Rhodoglobus sp.]